MGMGLPICQSIFEAHGGRILTAANDHGGAMFQFMLPVVISLKNSSNGS